MTTISPAAQEESAATKPTPLSVKLSPAVRQRLRNLAAQQRRPAHTLAREAIEAYIGVIGVRFQLTTATLARAPAGR